MKTLTPLELITSISIFSTDENEKIGQELGYAIGTELEKDPHYLELKRLCDDAKGLDVDSHIELFDNLSSYINSKQNIISTTVTIKRPISVSHIPKLFFGTDKIIVELGSDEEVMVTGTVAEFIKVHDYLFLSSCHDLSGKKIIIE
ncbi:hypothetical protein ACL00O_06895 [Aeromonas sanarellii]|uniref:hypothetical protein n=1 Tax=Aeromonas sanarellii TaxID=633415 RepID=UPI0039A2BBCB